MTRDQLLSKIQSLRAELDAIEANFDLTNRVKEGDDGEVAPLAASMNRLLEQLEMTKNKLETEKREAQRAVQAKGMFVANMSHEIRTPLHGILGTLELAFQAKPHPSVSRYLTLAKSSAESLLGIVNLVLDYSKIEAGKLRLDETSVYLPELIKNVWSGIGFCASEKELELLCCVSSDVPREFIQDKIRLQQIITNLLGNAVKFTKKGQVMLKISVFERAVDQTVLYLTVSDTGEGIPPEKQSTLFDAFVQADASVSRRHGGTGLGLAITKDLVGLMSGEIWLQSEVGKGTTFHMMIPVKNIEASKEYALKASIMNVRFESSLPSKNFVQEALEGLGWRFAEPDSHSTGVTIVDGYRSLFMNEAGRNYLMKLRSESAYPIIVLCPVGEVPALEQELLALDVVIVPKPYTPWELEKVALALITGEDPDDYEPLVQDNKIAVQNLKVLVVDDIYVNCLVAQRILEGHGLKVQAAKGGEEALALLEKAGNFGMPEGAERKSPFDLVLLDVQMPGLDGLETTRIIRKREEKTGMLPVIALSAHVGSEARERFLEAGMNAAVSKPFRLEDLLGSIADLTKDTVPYEKRPSETSAGKTKEQKNMFLNFRLPLDCEQLREKFSGDDEVILEILEAFVEEQPSLIKRLENAYLVKNGNEMQKASHAIKGSSASVCADNLYALSSQVENKIKARLSEGSPVLPEDLTLQVKLLIDLSGFTYTEVKKFLSTDGISGKSGVHKVMQSVVADNA